jgi:hypothetical protein
LVTVMHQSVLMSAFGRVVGVGCGGCGLVVAVVGGIDGDGVGCVVGVRG